MVPSSDSTEKPKPLTTPTSQHQPCSSLPPPPPLPPPPSLPDLNSSPPDQQQPLTSLGYSDQDIAAILSCQNDDLNDAADETRLELQGLLKRGFDETDAYYLGLFPLEYYDSVKNKRTRTFLYNNEDDDDPKGKKKLVESSDEDNYDHHHHHQRNEPLAEIDFLANFQDFYSDGDSDSDGYSDHDDAGVEVHHNIFDMDAYNRRQRKVQAAGLARPSKEDAPPSSPPPPVPQLELEFTGSNPFSNALKAIQERIKKRTKKNCDFPEPVTWVARRNEGVWATRFYVPSLLELSLKILANHADALVSLDGVADELKHGLSKLLCDSRRVNGHFVQLLLRGSPTEIRLRECSWMTEEQFLDYFRMFDTARLEVLQLDLCGRCLSDYTLHATLAQSPSFLPRLISLSLRGACRLTDKGLHVLVSCTPELRSINLSQCSLLTNASVNTLADSVGSLLKELYLDDCLHIDAALIVPALKRLEHLEVLSLGGLQTVSDKFIKDYIIACGHNMKELVLSDCIKLTDASIKVIAEHCPGLHALDLSNLCKLTDLSIGYLTNGCQELRTLKLYRNPLSDEAIAAFLETTGNSLTELSLNHISKVGQQTTLSLASNAKNLQTLDLSWCRILTDNDFGLIVDSCSSLRFLKIFGCSEVTECFLKGHSNPEIQIIGSKLSPIVPHVKVAPQGALRYSSVSVDSDLNSN